MNLKTRFYILSASYVSYDFDGIDDTIEVPGPINIISSDYNFLRDEFRGFIHTACEQCMAFSLFSTLSDDEEYDERKIYLPSFDEFWNNPKTHGHNLLKYLINNVSKIFGDSDFHITYYRYDDGSREFYCDAKIPSHVIANFKITIKPCNILVPLPDGSLGHMGSMLIPDLRQRKDKESIQNLWKRIMPYGYGNDV